MSLFVCRHATPTYMCMCCIYIFYHSHTDTHTHTLTLQSMASEDLKQNARMNIIRALAGSPKGDREATKSPPQVPPRPDLTPDEIARDRKLLVQNVVKTLQDESSPPLPSQRTVSPNPPSPKPRRARSPHTYVSCVIFSFTV